MSRKIFSELLFYLKQLSQSQVRRVRIFKLLLLSLPVFIYGIGLLRSGNDLAPGDADYYMQLYEAARRSIVEFHQFPWWNPWISGGIPLFANPQFGPISIQMVTTLALGSVFGYKLALIVYLIIGFLGMRQLMIKNLGADALRATLLSYIWVFSSFFVYRAMGHFTFFVIGLFVWVLYFYLNISEKRNWLWFTLTATALIWSSMHYTTVLGFVVIGLFSLWKLIKLTLQYYKNREQRNYFKYISKTLHIKKLVYSIILIGILTFPRIYTTLEYSHDYPRKLNDTTEKTTSVDATWYALFGPDQYNHPPQDQIVWGWIEASTYIGILTFFVFLISMLIFVQVSKNRNYINWWLLAMVGFCLIMARADFASWAPFTLSKEMPIFSSMRVATRWIAWSAFFILLFIASVKIKQRKLYYVTLLFMLLTVVELFVSGFRILNDKYTVKLNTYRSEGSSFTQRAHWNNYRHGISYDENLTEATRNNIGQIIAGDSLIDTRNLPGALGVPTSRCDEINPSCKYISENAVIEYWSPNKIIINRLAPGAIELNANVGSHWSINGDYPFSAEKVVDPALPFIITDESETIELNYKPRLLPVNLLKQIFR